MPTIFTQIINQTIPSYKIYEDELVYSFLDIYPKTNGHTLIVPKIEIDEFIDVPQEYYHRIWDVAQIIGKALKSAFNVPRVCILVEGFEISHFHCHLIPANSPQDLLNISTQSDTDSLTLTQNKILVELKKFD